MKHSRYGVLLRALRGSVRVTLGLVAVLIGLFAWSGAAGGTQPYETYESTVSGDAPVAQFRFDDAVGASTLADSAGSYTATNSGITLGGEGPFGGSKSGSFGGESYAAPPSNPLSGATAFTAEGWVDWTGGASYEQPIFDFGSSATNYMFLTPAGGSKHQLMFEIRTGTSTDVQVTASKLSANKWQYVAVTETSSGTLTLYVNGEQVGQTTGASLTPVSLATAGRDYLGKSQSITAPLFHGSLSNVAFYNTALSASRIQAHYDAGEFPTPTAPPTISGTATDGQTLTAKGGTWSGLTPITLSYHWTLCNVSGASCSNIPAATETKYKVSHEDVGQTLRVAVTGTNSAGSGTATSAQTAIVAALKPSNTVLPVIGGTAEVGQLLPVSTGSWEGSPPLTYTYQWETCNSSGKSCKAISGASASSYRVISSEVGDTLRAIVTAANSGGSVGATSEATATVTTGPPANTALPAISGTARDGQTLSASSGSWAGTEPITYSYQWQSCNSSGEACSNISGATGSTHGLGSSDVGSTLRVVVTAKNSVGSTNATSPPSPVVGANAPSNTAAPTIGGTATDGQTLSAGTGSWSGSTPLSYAYQWESCNSSGEACAPISGATGSTYALGHGDVGTRLRVVVTASNSGGSASSTSAKTATVAALAPSNTAAPTIGGIATDGQTLTATTGEWAGTPSFTFSYQWERCNGAGEACADISGATGSTYTLVHADAGHAVRVAVSAENVAGSSTQHSAPSGEVLPLAPSNTARPEVTGTAKQGQTLIASAGSWSGTPSFSYGYQWQDCDTFGESCLDIAGATASSYVPAHSDVGSTLRVAVTATNAAGSNTSDSDLTPTVIESSCTDTWVGASEGSWQTAANWSNDAVPDSEDVACIEAGTTVQIGSGSNQAAAVKDAGALALTGGSLTLTSTNKASEVSAFGLSNATLNVAGELGVSGSFAESGQSQIEGGGRLAVDSGVSGSLGSGCGYLILDGVTFANEGSLVFGASGGVGDGAIAMRNGAQLDNSGTFTDDSYDTGCGYGFGGSSIYNDGGATPSVMNSGTFVVNGGSQAINVQVPFNNDKGMVSAQAGTLQLTAGGTSEAGEILAAEGAGVAFTGGPFTASGDTWSGSGSIAIAGAGVTETNLHASGAHLGVSGGALAVPSGSTASIGGLSMSGGALNVAGELGVSGSFAESGQSQIEGGGRFVIGSGVSGSLGSGCGYLILDGVTFVNEGSLVFGASGGAGDGAIAMRNGAQLDNAGTVEDDSYDSGCGYGFGGSSFYNDGGATSSVTNTGTFRVHGGSQAINVQVPFNNDGVVSAQAGTLQLTAGGTGTSGEWSSAAGAALVFTGGSFALSGDTWSGAGAIVVSGAGVTVTDLHASGAHVGMGGGALAVSSGSTVDFNSLSLSGGALNVAGELDVSGSFIESGQSQIEGGGRLVIGSSASGTLGSGCGYLILDGVTFVNEGSLVFGASGGAGDGVIAMRDGAQLQNVGTFEDDSYDPGCGYGFGGSSFYNDGGATSSITNTGTFLVNAGGQTINVYVPFDNGGAITAASGTLDLRAGGVAEHVAVGAWTTEGAGAIVLGGGEFLIAEAVNLADVRVEGATVTRVPVSGPPRGSLNPHPYASGGVTISGSGEAIGSGFSASMIEITPAGQNEWKALCGPLTPGLMGSFGCEWNTAAPGLYPDGHYQLRAQLSDSSEPPNTAPTSAITVLVDNTPPAGSLTVPSGPLSGASMVSGSATDGGSGVASWQLQIAPKGSGEWSDACPAQVKAASGDTYECPLETTSYANGAYDLRVLITDNAGNTYATTPVEATIDNTAPANTTAPAISGSAEDGQTLSASAGSWSGTQPISYAYQWQSCNSAGEACTNISGATEATYVLGHGAVGTTLRVTVTATNLEGATSASSVPTSVVVALPPSDATPPSISGVAQEGQTLTADEGTWNGTPPLTYSYQWQECDSTGASCVAIEGATEATLALAAAHVGHTIRAEVTATNSVGSSSSVSAPSAVVVIQLPLDTVAPSIGGSVVVGATLTAENGAWYGEKPITYAHQWESCTASGEDCTPIEGATGSSFTPSAAEVGHAIRLLVTATNSLGTGEATSATTAAVEGYAGGSACNDTWTGAAGDGSWDTARNWAGGGVPGAGDHVCIPSGASVTASSSGDQAGWITDEGTLAIVYGSLTVNGPEASTFEVLEIEHGTLTGAGGVTIGGSLIAGDYGTITGSGAFTIEHGASATVTPTGGDGVYLSERTLTNDGTLTVERGSGLSGSNHASLVNNGTLVLNGESYGEGHGLNGREATLVNTGTVEKTEGSGDTPIEFAVQNEGTITAKSGQIELSGGGSSGGATAGTWSATGHETKIVFAGSTPAALGASATLAGAIEINGTTVNVGTLEGPTAEVTVDGRGGMLEVTNSLATSTLSALNVEGAQLANAAELDITGTFTGGGYGWMSGSGATVIEPGATGSIAGQWITMEAQTLRNEGTMTVPTAEGLLGRAGAHVVNSGTLIVNGETAGENHGMPASSGEATLTNTGVVKKTEGSGDTVVGFAIDNDGEVSAESGELEFSGGGESGTVSPGSWSATHTGASIVFNTNSYTTTSLGATVPMAGTIEFVDGTVTAGKIEGDHANVTTRARGTLLVTNAGAASTIANLAVEGGELGGAAEVDVSEAFTGGGYGWMSGSGSTLIEPGATGTMTGPWITVEGRTLSNEGTLTVGTNTGILGRDGAHLVNDGTLIVNGEDSASNYGLLASRGEATLTNAGVLKKTEGSGSTRIGFAIDNEGTVDDETGELEFSGGGESGAFATDIWNASSGTTITFNEAYEPGYSLGANATFKGRIFVNSSLTVGTLEGSDAELISQRGNLTLTGTSASTLKSLTFLQPDYEFYFNQQGLSIASELEVTSNLTWSSNNAWLSSGTLLAGPESTTLFDPGAWIQIRGGTYINEGTARWTTGGFQANESGTFFINRGDFKSEQDGGNAVVQGCEYNYGGSGYNCPRFVNEGLFTAVFPASGAFVPYKVIWTVDLLNKGELDVPYETEPFCKWEYSEVPGPGAEACYRAIYEFKGLMLRDEASVIEEPWEVWITGTPEEGQELTAHSSPLLGRTASSVKYQWDLCDGAEPGETVGRQCEEIEGASGPTYEVTEEDVGLTLRVVGSVPDRLAPKASAATAIIEEPEPEFGEFEETPEEESATREREELEQEEGAEPAAEMSRPFFDFTPFAESSSSNEWKILHYFKVPPASGYRHYTTLREGRPPGTANPKKEQGWGWRKIRVRHPEVTIKKMGEVLANPSIPPEVHGVRFTYVLEEVQETTGCSEGGCIDEFKGTEWRVVVERKIQDDNEESGVITAYSTPVNRSTIDIF